MARILCAHFLDLRYQMFDVHGTTAAAYAVAVDGDTFTYSAVNRACFELSGLGPSVVSGLDPRACFTSTVADDILRRYRTCRDSRQAMSYVSEVKLASGPRRWRTTLFPMADGNGRVVSIVGVCVDASGETSVDQTIETNHEKLALAMGAMDGGFWVYEMETGVFETSESLARYIAGPGHRSLNLAEYASYIYAEDLGGQHITSATGDRTTADYRVVVFDGRTRWLQSRRRIFRNKAGAAVRVIGLVTDITDQKKAMSALEAEASTDPLTSLKNRRAFDRAAAQALADARKGGGAIALLLIDLDGFKPINDRFGHRAGDEILRKVARRLTRGVGDGALLARLGGDEFGVLLEDATEEAGRELAIRLADSLARPLRLETHTIHVGASMGLAVSAPGEGSVEALIERADRDLYAMKRRSRLKTA